MSEERASYGNASILRVRKDANYFSASNVPFNDKRLNWEARGVMGYLLSKPDNWVVRMDDLIKQGPASIRIIKRVMAELKQYGYVTREIYKTADGKFHWNTTIYETPELNTTTGTIRTDGTIGTNCIDGKRIDIVSTYKPPSTDSDIDIVATKIEELRFRFNPNTGTIISIWKDWFADDVIVRALEMSRGKNINYADSILIGWKANGVPPTRDEQIAAAKNAPKKPTQYKQNGKMPTDEFNAKLAEWVRMNEDANV